MKKILYTLGLFCSIFFSACNESTEIEIPEALPTVEDDGADVTFTPEQLKLSGKKGVCLKLGVDVRETNIAKINQLGAAWNYSWGWEFVDGQPADKEFIPMFWGKGSVTSTTLTYLKEQILNGRCKRVLGFNEPDGEKQANMTVEQALELWPQLQSLKVPLGSPAIVDAAKGEWLEEFMAGCEERGYRVDFICVHNYGGVGVEAFKTKMQGIIDKYGLPILITEFAVADWSATTVNDNKYKPEQVLDFMKEVLPWLEQNDMVLGYAWFQSGIDSPQGWSGAFYDKDGQLTELGEYYMNFTLDTGGDEGDGGDEGNNLVKNPGFEEGLPANADGVDGWKTNGNTVLEKTNVISGTQSLRLTGVNSYISTQQKITVVSGKTYKFGLKGRIQDKAGAEGSSSNTSESRVLSMIIRKPDNNDNQYASVETNSSINTEISGEITIDSGITEVEILIVKPSGIAYVDDVYFQEK